MMRRLAAALVAIAGLAVLAIAPRPAAANAPCPVTIHVTNAGGFSLSNCKGARKTTQDKFHGDLAALLEDDPSEEPKAIVDADPKAPFLATVNAMNWAQDVGIKDFTIIDEPGRPAFSITMPALTFPPPPPLDGEPTQEEIDKAGAPQPPKPAFIAIRARRDHLIDVYLPGPPLRPDGRTMVKPDPDPERKGYFWAKGVKIETLSLLMPAPTSNGMASVGASHKLPWSQTRAIYRALAAAGWGRLISETPA